MITIIDYKVGNLGSISNMLKKIGVESKVTSNINEILNADKLILPGVGAFNSGMLNLKNSGLLEVLNKKVLVEKTPVLGICLGAQLMCNSSEEGNGKGLGWVDIEVKKFDYSNIENRKKFKVPHMGWNYTDLEKESRLFKNFDLDARFYFVHSYYMNAISKKDVLTTTNYGRDFVSSFEKENILGVQFHPEKSHKLGMRLLSNFNEYY